MSSINMQSTVRQVGENVYAELGADSSVALNIEQGAYYELNPVARLVLSMLATPNEVHAIVERVCIEYDVSVEQCREDVVAFLERLLAEGLIHVS